MLRGFRSSYHGFVTELSYRADLLEIKCENLKKHITTLSLTMPDEEIQKLVVQVHGALSPHVLKLKSNDISFLFSAGDEKAHPWFDLISLRALGPMLHAEGIFPWAKLQKVLCKASVIALCGENLATFERIGANVSRASPLKPVESVGEDMASALLALGNTLCSNPGFMAAVSAQFGALDSKERAGIESMFESESFHKSVLGVTPVQEPVQQDPIFGQQLSWALSSTSEAVTTTDEGHSSPGPAVEVDFKKHPALAALAKDVDSASVQQDTLSLEVASPTDTVPEGKELNLDCLPCEELESDQTEFQERRAKIAEVLGKMCAGGPAPSSHTIDQFAHIVEGYSSMFTQNSTAADADNEEEFAPTKGGEAKDDGQNNCCICLEPYGSETLTSACRHRFHKACLVEWMTWSAQCPLCKQILAL